MLRRFYGGVSLRDQKSATRRKKTVPVPPPPFVVLPMTLHDGPPCIPCVRAGDAVQIGQVVGRPDAMGVPILAGVSGTVAAVEPRPYPGGGTVLSVVLGNDGLGTRLPPLPRLPAYDRLTAEEIARRAEEAGLVELTGSGEPIHHKIRAAAGLVDTLLINAAESEAYVTADHRLMLERPEDVLTGIRILMRALRVRRAVVGIERNKMDAIVALQGLLPLRGGEIRVKALRARYPQGGERQMVQRLTGRLVPPGETAVSVRCAVFSVSAVAAVRDAVVDGARLTERIVTVSGPGVVNPCNLIVPFGTPLGHLVEAAGGLTDSAACLLTGGPVTGTAQTDWDIPLLCGTNVLVAAQFPPLVWDDPCIRCGRCRAACPMRLCPDLLDTAARAGRFEELARLYIGDCMECGTCAYLCPARIPLVQGIRDGKAALCRARESAGEEEAP